MDRIVGSSPYCTPSPITMKLMPLVAQQSGQTTIWPLVVFGIGLTLTLVGGGKVREIEEAEASRRVDVQIQTIADELTRRFEKYATVATAGGALFQSGNRLTSANWHRFAATFGLGAEARPPLPGLVALGYARLEVLPGSEPKLPEWQAPLEFIQPAGPRISKLIGLDVLRNPLLAETTSLAVDAAEPRLSPKLMLLDESEPGVLIIAPVYQDDIPPWNLGKRRENARGIVFAALRFEELLQDLDSRAGLIDQLQIFDGPAIGNPEALIHGKGPLLTSRHQHQAEVSWGGRVWWLQATESENHSELNDRTRSRLTFVVGFLATALLSLLAAYQGSLQSRAERQARKMTHALVESQNELRRHRDTLARQVDERTSQLLQAKETAERANRAKSDFLNNMSHELRTPLHAILSFARLGETKANRVDTAKLISYFTTIHTSGTRLLALVTELLDLSKLEAGKVDYQFARHDLATILRDVAAELENVAGARNLSFRLPPLIQLAPAIIDSARMAQVIRNLYSNAIKFSDPGKEIEVKIAETALLMGRRQSDDEVWQPAWQILVLDRGMGIPEDETEAIFDKFFQSTKTRSTAGGTGLGLPICREIVRAHRGTIQARNRQGGGSEFEVILPRLAKGGDEAISVDSARNRI
jgi:signal transduction histidine kinase